MTRRDVMRWQASHENLREIKYLVNRGRMGTLPVTYDENRNRSLTTSGIVEEPSLASPEVPIRVVVAVEIM